VHGSSPAYLRLHYVFTPADIIKCYYPSSLVLLSSKQRGKFGLR